MTSLRTVFLAGWAAGLCACGAAIAPTDGGTPADSGGRSDAGSAADGGPVPDAGPAPDAGTPPADGGGSIDAGPPPVADLYVSPQGDDGTGCNGPGTLAEPLATPDCARQRIGALTGLSRPRLVVLRGGLYPLSAPLALTATDTGTQASPIYWQGYPGELPVISGGRALPALSASGCPATGTWCVTLTPSGAWADFQLLYTRDASDADWTRRDQPFSTGDAASASYLVIKGPVGTASTEFQTRSASDVPSGWASCFAATYNSAGVLTGPHPCRVGSHAKWDWAWSRISSLDQGVSPPGVVVTGPTVQNANQGFLAGHKYLVQNVKEVYFANPRAYPGGWYLDQTVYPWILSYTPTATEAAAGPASVSFIAPQLAAPFVTLDRTAYITFQGIGFSFGNFTIPAAGWGGIQFDAPSLDNLCGAVPCGVAPAVRVLGSHHVVFDGAVVAHNASAGVMFTQAAPGATPDPWLGQFVNGAAYDNGANNVIVEEPISPSRPTFTHSDTTVAHHIRVQNNVLTDCCKIAAGAYSVLAGDTHHSAILNNEIARTTNSGIGLGSALGNGTGGFTHDNTVAYNDIHQIAQGITDDIGCIYTLVGLPKDPTSGATLPHANNVLTHNVCHDVWFDTIAPDGYGANGIYLDQNSSGELLDSNLIFRTEVGVFFHAGQDHTLSNDVVALPSRYAINMANQGTGPVPFVFNGQHDLIYYAQAAATIQSPTPEWACPNGCFAVYTLSSNLYFEDTGLAPVFRTDSAHASFSLAQWQTCPANGSAVPCEDKGSVRADPGFANPHLSCTSATGNDPIAPAHCFDVPASGTAASLGFVPWDYSQAGLTAGALPIPSVPGSFPTPPSTQNYGELP